MKNMFARLLPAVLGAAALLWIEVSLGSAALATAVLLIILEVTLSFDNAVVNAGVLRGMTPIWQWRFLTWGMFFAVFGSRALLPILIVSFSTLVSPLTIAWIAFNEPGHYGELLEGAHYIIDAFGGMFLVMVAFKYFFDAEKEIHWIHVIEKRLSSLGSIEAIEMLAAMCLLTPIAFLVGDHFAEIMVAGIIGIVIFVFVHEVIDYFGSHGETAAGTGLALFIYLNVLDTAFSLDSVIGAFALTSNILIISVGLGIGAYFVRRLTLYLVDNGTLNELIYLEHGAHWAILGLAAAMLAGLFVEVPEPITGFVGLTFISLAYISSKRLRLQ